MIKKKAALFLSVSLLMTPWVFGAEEIANVSPEMEKPAFWIERLPEPDKVLLTPYQIKRFNQKFLRTEPTADDPLTLKKHVSPLFFIQPIEKE